MKRCMYCGHENEDTSDNCAKCGNPLLSAPATDLPLEEVPEETPAEVQQDVDVNAQQTNDLNNVFEAGQANGAEGQFGYLPENDPGMAQGAVGYDQQTYGGQQYGGQAYGYAEQPREYGQQPYEEQRPYDYDPRFNTQVNPGRTGMGPLTKKARRRVKSPLFFLMTVLYTAYTIAAILNVVLGNAVENIFTVSHTITKMVGENVAINFMNSLVQLIKGVKPLYLMGAGLITLIPSVFLVLGLWMTFLGTTNKKANNSTAGFNMCNFAIIIKFIGVCAVFLAAIAFSVAFVVSAGAASSVMSLIAGVIVLLIMIILTVFAILYYVQVIYSIKVVKNNAKTGADIGKIPGFAVFVGFLGCVVTVLAMLPMAPDDYIGLAAKAAYAAWLLLGVLWALIYKATVRVKVK